MLKCMGILLILTGAWGFGWYLGDYLKKRVLYLTECREIFAQMDAARNFLRLPYAQLLRRAAKEKRGDLEEMLYGLADEMEKNREADAGALWEEALSDRKKQLLLTDEEVSLMLSLARSLMLEGDHTQVARMYFLQLEDRIRKAEEEKKDRQKLYRTVSVLGGLFLVILLL